MITNTTLKVSVNSHKQLYCIIIYLLKIRNFHYSEHIAFAISNHYVCKVWNSVVQSFVRQYKQIKICCFTDKEYKEDEKFVHLPVNIYFFQETCLFIFLFNMISKFPTNISFLIVAKFPNYFEPFSINKRYIFIILETQKNEIKHVNCENL